MSERQAVNMVRDLLTIVQDMHAAYQNDQGQRAKAIGELNARADKLARPFLDSYPANYGSRSRRA